MSPLRSWLLLPSTAVFLLVHSIVGTRMCTTALTLPTTNPAQRPQQLLVQHADSSQPHNNHHPADTTPPAADNNNIRRMMSRRAWWWTSVAAAVGMATPAVAYERRDVGGQDASPETKAMNEQAYQTQSRLERAGLRIEVRVCVCVCVDWKIEAGRIDFLMIISVLLFASVFQLGASG
jgi:hypothetical protein